MHQCLASGEAVCSFGVGFDALLQAHDLVAHPQLGAFYGIETMMGHDRVEP